MGQSSSKYDSNRDPCRIQLKAYLDCVESKKTGLKEGDECKIESSAYKQCRKQHKLKKNSEAK